MKLELGSGQSLWQRAREIIPGGNMLLSKRAEMFLPDLWPAYFSKSSGCTVWDLDGNPFTDVSIMGIGTNLLGYGHPRVDEAVLRVIESGNMSTFNCPEEVALAEKLLELNQWAGMVRFTRSGGEANAVAIRIARAASGRDGVALCGYHGWHDWYLAANLADDEALDGHLLPGLEPRGVPRALRSTVFPFEYNNLEQLAEIIRNESIGVIKMEVSRGVDPEDGFLQGVRDLATKNGIVLIFDECTSGFRESYGGLFNKYGVEPDMAMFGKALGNGYAIAAVVGRKEIMQAAQTTFISSTFWTERIGPTAALASLEVMENEKSWEIVSARGRYVKERWREISESHGVGISIGGLDALASFTFASTERHQEFRTFITQELLKEGFLAATSIYLSLAHTAEILDNYLDHFSVVLARIADADQNGDPLPLEGPVAHSGFKRLN